MGVKNAFTKSIEFSQNHNQICCYGEIVHNRFALESLYNSGIKVLHNIDDIVNNDEIYNVIIRAHGIPPDEELKIRNKKNIVDLTCPKVKSVQMLAKQLADEDYFIIILGKTNHPEVKGICGYCPEKHIVIKNITELKDNLSILYNNKKLSLICQTTANPKDFSEISEFISNNQINLKINNTLCNAPILIQEETIALAKKVDLMIIVGDKQSANTTTLYELSKNICQSIFVETINDIKGVNISNYNIIGLSGGSSTPQSQIDDIKNYLEKSKH